MYRRIDRSSFLTSRLQRISNQLARRRGVPIVFGILLVIISLLLDLVVQADPLSGYRPTLATVQTIALHLGLLSALIGLLLVQPLGD